MRANFHTHARPYEAASSVYGWANVFLIGALVVGAISTVLVVWMGNVKEAYLNRELSAAQVEIAKIKAPRLLKDEQVQAVINATKSFAGQHVSLGAIPFSFEAASFADQIVRALKTAGINADFNQGAAEVQVGAVSGIFASAVKGNPRGEAFAAAFTNVLNGFGIKASWSAMLEESIMQQIEKEKPGWRQQEGNSWVVIVVGDKT